MICEVTMYQAVCDRCGRICASIGGIIAWTDTESAKYVALESGWKEINGKIYCPTATSTSISLRRDERDKNKVR